MDIYEGKLKDLLSWFETEQKKSDALILFVSNTKHASEQVRGMLKDIVRIDSILGKRTTLMLFGPRPQVFSGIVGDFGRLGVIGGELISATPAPYGTAKEMRSYDPKAMNRTDVRDFERPITNTTISMTEEIINLAGISKDQMPCLVVFLRGIEEPCNVTLGLAKTSDDIVEVLRKIVALYDDSIKHVQEGLFKTEEIRNKLQSLETLNIGADRIVTDIIKALRELKQRYSLPDDALERMISSYYSFRFSGNPIALISEMSGGNPAIMGDEKMLFLQERTAHLSKICAQLSFITANVDVEAELKEADIHRAAMETLSDKIAALNKSLKREFGINSKFDVEGKLVKSSRVWLDMFAKAAGLILKMKSKILLGG